MGLLELESGTLETDGNLDLGGAVLRISSGGKLDKGSGDAAYSGDLASLHYTGGGDLMTGDEIKAPTKVTGKPDVPASFNNLEIAVDGMVTLSQPVQIAGGTTSVPGKRQPEYGREILNPEQEYERASWRRRHCGR